jgi:hypothetical protein
VIVGMSTEKDRVIATNGICDEEQKVLANTV